MKRNMRRQVQAHYREKEMERSRQIKAAFDRRTEELKAQEVERKTEAKA